MKRQHLTEGGTVWVQGHEFTVTNLRILFDDSTGGTGKHFARFTGICTDHPCNDSIRRTGYNGGTYGGNDLVYTW